MSFSVRHLVLPFVLCAPVAAGCTSSVEAEEAPVGDLSASAATVDGENVAQTSQAVTQQHSLFACPGDIYATLTPYNNVNTSASTGWVSNAQRCVNFYVNRNLSNPAGVPAEVWATADFPQYEGTYTQAKADACRASKVELRIAQRFGTSGSWGDEYIEGWGWYATPTVKLVNGTVKITSCTAQYVRGPGCSYFTKYNNMRVDVMAVPGTSTGASQSRVQAVFKNDTHC